MQFMKCFVVLVVLFGRLCLSKIKIEINKPDGSTELQEAAIRITTDCYAHHHKTVALMGDFPVNFIKKLSVHRSFSLILINDRFRAGNVIRHLNETDLNRKYKVDIVIGATSHQSRWKKLLYMYEVTPYFNPNASFLILGWSLKNKYAMCHSEFDILKFIVAAAPKVFLNLKIMCCDRAKATLIFNSNTFTNRTPEPWKFIASARYEDRRPDILLLGQRFREHANMCKNLDFDKTSDWGGMEIILSGVFNGTHSYNETEIKHRIVPLSTIRWILIDHIKAAYFVEIFCEYKNITLISEMFQSDYIYHLRQDLVNVIETEQIRIQGLQKIYRPYSYPTRRACRFIITQNRGNKSQCKKIIDVIDAYSWIGMFLVSIINLIFFKVCLRQSLVEGILNLIRLTSNCGVTGIPSNLGPKMYLSCLLFFVVTMQGIFVGNLAALLTQDVPVRQVDSVQDLIDLGYTVYVYKEDLGAFDHPELEGRIITMGIYEECLLHIQRDPLVACTMWGTDSVRAYALQFGLYISRHCYEHCFLSTLLPSYWALEQRFRQFTLIMTAAGIFAPLDTMVEEKRLIEFESQEDDPDPKVITIADLDFALVILGTGLGIAFLVFIAEIILDRFNRRVRTTRVIVLS